MAQLLVQVPALARAGLMPRPSSLWHPALGQVLLLMVPFTFTAGGRQVLNVVASNVITGIDAGAQGAFYLADLFLSLLLGLFSISPALAYYSRLSQHAADNSDRFGPTLAEGLRFITFLTVPAGLALTLLAAPSVDAVYNWRSLFGTSMDEDLRAFTIAATLPLGLSVFPIGAFNLLVRAFYVRRSVRTPVLLVLGFLTLQGVLYVLLSRPYGIAGISWATVIAAWAQLLAAGFLVARRERFDLGDWGRQAMRVWLASLVAVVLAHLALQAVNLPESWFGQVGRLLVGGVVVVTVYAGLGALLRVQELAALGRLFRR